MANIRTQKHEMEYDPDTCQAIFNGGRNKTAASPIHKAFPARIAMEKTPLDLGEIIIKESELDPTEDEIYEISFKTGKLLTVDTTKIDLDTYKERLVLAKASDEQPFSFENCIIIYAKDFEQGEIYYNLFTAVIDQSTPWTFHLIDDEESTTISVDAETFGLTSLSIESVPDEADNIVAVKYK